MKSTLLTALALIAFFVYSPSAYAVIPDLVIDQKKAVVTIYTSGRDGKIISTGTGFLIESDGVIVTNYHVISKLLKSDNSLLIKLESGVYLQFRDLLDFDKEADVALLKVDGIRLPFIATAKNHKPKQGDNVVVIGSPLGLETTISDGIISSIRSKDGLLQITAPISQGSSGSPVINSNGEAIGIVTYLVLDGQNLNFAIPIKYALMLLDKVSSVKINSKLRTDQEHQHKSGIAEKKTTSPQHKPIPETYEIKLYKADALYNYRNYKQAEKEYTSTWMNFSHNQTMIPYIVLQIAKCHLEQGSNIEALNYLLYLDSVYPKSDENLSGKNIISNKKWFAADESNPVDFIDATSISSSNDNIVRALVKRVQSKSSYAIIDMLFDCSRGRFQPTESVEYRDDTIEAKYEIKYPEWFSVSQNTYAKTFWNVACRKSSLFQ